MSRVRKVPSIFGLGAALSAALVSGCLSKPEGEVFRPTIIFGEPGLFPGQFSYPRAIESFGDSILVVDKSARIQRLEAKTGRYLGGFRMPEWDLGKPTGLTVGPSPFDPGSAVLYVADTHYHRVAVYPIPDDPDADARRSVEPLFSFGEYGTGLGQFVYVTDVAIDADDTGSVCRIYVSEYGGNDRITVFELEGGQVVPRFTFGYFADGPGEVGSSRVPFERPQAIEIDDRARELIVLDTCNHRIARLSMDGELIAWIGDDPGEATFLNPQGLVLLESRRALVAEFLGNRVQVVDLDSGKSLGTYGVAGRMPGELASPWAVTAIGDRGYVLDSGNNRVQGFRIDSSRLAPPWSRVASWTHAGGRP